MDARDAEAGDELRFRRLLYRSRLPVALLYEMDDQKVGREEWEEN